VRNSDQPLTPGINVRSHVDGLGVGICNKVCSSCLRNANLAFNKCCSAATPLPKKIQKNTIKIKVAFFSIEYLN
jgi:hypothetical protein